MEQRVSLVTLGVTDLGRARAFYEALGWHGAQQPDDEVCFFQAGDMVFGLWRALVGHGAPGIELAHNVRSSAEVESVLAEAQRAGGSVVRPAARAEWGRHRRFRRSGRLCLAGGAQPGLDGRRGRQRPDLGRVPRPGAALARGARQPAPGRSPTSIMSVATRRSTARSKGSPVRPPYQIGARVIAACR